MTEFSRIQLRQDTAENWEAANTLLALGEEAIDLTTGRKKLGNGVDRWNDLPFQTTTEVEAEIAAQLPDAAESAVNNNLAARDIGYEDAGGGQGYLTVGETRVGSARPWPAGTTWSGLTKPAASVIRGDIDAPGNADVKLGQSWWDTVFAAPASDDTPTVSVATTGAVSGGTSVVPTVSYQDDTHFRYDGCADVASGGTGLVAPVQPLSTGAAYAIVPEFVTSPGCDKIDIILRTNSAGSVMGIRLIINGRWLTLPVQWYAATPNTTHYVRLTFPTAKARSIRVESVNVASFGGVVVPSGETTYRPAREIRKRMVILGDSYTAGANGNSTSDPATNGTSRFETFPNYVAKLLGCDSVINLGVGGTGWMSPGSAATTFGQRISDIIAASPHIVLAAGSRNDNSYSNTQVYNAAVAALQQLVDFPIVEVCGLEDAGSGSGTAGSVLNEAVKQAARTIGFRFNDMFGVIESSDKNSADSVHPSVLGHQKLAKAFYAALDRPRVDEAVAASVGGRASIDLTLTASPSSAATSGATVTLTATQSTSRAGKVAFYANNVLLGTVTVSGGSAVYTTSTLAVGTYTFTARFIPSNPLLVKPATASNAVVGYVISANLGFVDHFGTDGSLVATENGKAYSALGSITASVSGGVATPTVTSGTGYIVADAGTPNGTYSVKLGGTTANAAIIPLRTVSQLNTLRLQIVSSQIVLQQVVSNTTTTLFTGAGGAWAAGDVISVVLNGDTITVKKNGTDVPGLTGVTVSQFNSVTKFGIGTNTVGTNVTFDDLTFVAA